MVFLLLLLFLHFQELVDHLLDLVDLGRFNYVLTIWFGCSLEQSTFVFNGVALFHQDAVVMILARLLALPGILVALVDELLGDVVPVPQAALHDALDKANFLEGGPVRG